MDSQTIALFQLLAIPLFALLVVALAVWSLVWKGIGLWKAAKNNQRNWFIAMLVINTLGILEIIYIFRFSKPKQINNEHLQKENQIP